MKNIQYGILFLLIGIICLGIELLKFSKSRKEEGTPKCNKYNIIFGLLALISGILNFFFQKS